MAKTAPRAKAHMLFKALAVGLLLAVAPLLETPMAHAEVEGLVTLPSAKSLPDAEAALVTALEGAGLKVAARIDHAANARSVGQDLAPTVLLIFGNPAAGTRLMQAGRSVAIDLPIKALLWEQDGKTFVSYNDPAWLARRHGLTGVDPVVQAMQGALAKFAAAAVGKQEP